MHVVLVGGSSLLDPTTSICIMYILSEYMTSESELIKTNINATHELAVLTRKLVSSTAAIAGRWQADVWSARTANDLKTSKKA